MIACARPALESDRALAERVRRQIRDGDLHQALALADRGWARWQRRPDSETHWEFRLLRAQVLIHQGKAPEASALLAEELPPGDRFASLRVRRLMCLGRVHFLQADYPASRRLLEEALRLARQRSDPLLLAEVQLWRGSTLARSGQFDAADQAYREGLELAARHGDLYLEAAGFGNRGFVRLNSSRFDEAIPFFQQALRLAERAAARRFHANTLGNLGRCYAGLGDYAKAAPLLRQAAARLGELGDANAEQIWLGNLGETYHLERDYPAAASCYLRALEISRRLSNSYFTLMWLNKLTELGLEAGDLRQAESCNREALELAPRVATRDAGIWSHLWSARLLAEHGRWAEAEARYRQVLASASAPEELGVTWAAHAGLAALYAAAGRPRQAEEQFRRALSSLEATRSRLSRDEWKLSFQARSLRFYQDYVDFLMSRGAAERALEVAEASRARVLMQKLGLGSDLLRTVSAGRLRRTAREFGAALLSFWLAPRRSFLWVVQPGAVRWFPLPPEGEIRPLIEALRGATEGLQDLIATDNQAARRLYEILLRPAAPLLGPRARVIVAPDGPLHEINLETLLIPSLPRRYWIQEATVAIAPSLALLAEGRLPARRGPDSLLLIGDPSPASEQFPRLPEVEREIQGIRRRFAGSGHKVLTGPAAHPAAYAQADPANFSLIHFAAHAVASPDNPLDSAVILAARPEAGKLYARDVVAIPLAARLVTLSACRGAGARLYSGEGLVGFAWAFLQAGARNVIAGLWDVHDSSTAALMEGLYEELAAGRPPAEALRTAKRALIASRSAWSKPFYWGAFQLYSRAEPF